MANNNEQSSVRRRRFLKAAGATAAATALAGCGGGGGGGGGNDSAKIGILAPLSGATPTTGQEVRRGTEMAKEHLGGQILGSDFELVVRDTQSTPSGALEGARSLVTQEDVDAIIGPSLSSSTASVVPYIKNEAQIPILPTQASATEAREGDNCSDYSFFIWPSNRHAVSAGVDFINDLSDHIDRDFDPKRMHFFAADYSLGQNNLSLLRERLSEEGGEVTGTTLAPLGTQDLSSYISELLNSDAKLITGVMPASLAITLINQAQDYNLKEEKILMFNSGKPVNQIVQASVGGAADGWYGTTFYNPTSDSEINQTFKELYPSDSTSLLPNAPCGSGFETLRALAKAMEQAGSTDGDDVVNALGGLNWQSVFGDTTFRASDGQIEVDFIGATRQNTEFTPMEEYSDVIPPNMC
ncbi:ABC transporter substrate-binding protein [Halarchaeum nitratireducens]|uniref:Leucine-binding protein domain-containing protein n=1 Tax=Halarchaeum nitratireducens TaxID=489913 RepID=A0A830G9H9_9EURY|nr:MULTISPECIES: ABC transporter substrate-binding protein [Halarchaeum]MBP2249779.1 branched-chain amino acid transport system substrate-binding protein [Halarchaeum solikamskense]GGN10633.1 hypothetical protein GCM10009021_08130 [Halarchaeum nitratireducens]